MDPPCPPTKWMDVVGLLRRHIVKSKDGGVMEVEVRLSVGTPVMLLGEQPCLWKQGTSTPPTPP